MEITKIKGELGGEYTIIEIKEEANSLSFCYRCVNPKEGQFLIPEQEDLGTHGATLDVVFVKDTQTEIQNDTIILLGVAI